jgi:hypothetical protein
VRPWWRQAVVASVSRSGKELEKDQAWAHRIGLGEQGRQRTNEAQVVRAIDWIADHLDTGTSLARGLFAVPDCRCASATAHAAGPRQARSRPRAAAAANLEPRLRSLVVRGRTATATATARRRLPSLPCCSRAAAGGERLASRHTCSVSPCPRCRRDAFLFLNAGWTVDLAAFLLQLHGQPTVLFLGVKKKRRSLSYKTSDVL